MRIYSNPLEAVKETERDLWEMGIEVHPQTMQDKDVGDNFDYVTKEIRGYSFKITDWVLEGGMLKLVMAHFFGDKEADNVLTYAMMEFRERIAGKAINPGRSYLLRHSLWKEYLHDGKFAYTYSERIAPQLETIFHELSIHPESRQGVINIHSNICPERPGLVTKSNDLANLGGGGRVPCSMYYQVMVREGKVDLVYTMRSCDFLIHFPVDISIALMLQDWFADLLGLGMGTFTYFTGSLHAYHKDMIKRGIF